MTQPLPLYLGPALPRWAPQTTEDVQEAIDDGSLRENHWFDFKREVGSSDEARKKIAAALASFAIDGGALIIGADEDKRSQQVTLAPQDLRGLPERVSQLARSRCDPPLYVACRPIPVAGDDTRGLLLVEVPPSAGAPHMVDGRYYGRGDTTKHFLSDAEVERHVTVRSAHRFTAEQLIQVEIARDPVGPTDEHLNGHVYVVAKPRVSRPDLLTSAIEDRSIGQLVHALARRLPGNAVPNWQHASHSTQRAEGAAWHSGGLPSRQYRPREFSEEPEDQLIDLEVQDDGTVALFCGKGTFIRRDHSALNDYGIVLFSRGVVELAGDIGREYRYGGQWLLATGVTRTRGLPASSTHFQGYSPMFNAEQYLRSTEAVTSELCSRPGAVTKRLVDRLMRGLGTAPTAYRGLLDD
ncbi:AlbA family DNA-binding domain-containing protein [Paractinoplanes hotanensis]|uniref:ATP-binding protein n=1 Tax=Paractinoplanes hotanensis TaxID=2906497 RepID=A0ABT0YEF2_9ACTN|nr:ATP-binding protein [Actinoplanes hotanensis]MCM4083897.1 ATP-binding protein [Actinoplanes hotanensis]